MTITWRREDFGYFAAAVASAVVIAYVLIGNFGLVPSPFAAPDTAPTVQAAIDPVLNNTVFPDVEVSPVSAPEPSDPVRAPVPPPAAGADATAPNVEIQTQPGASFGLAAPAFVEGIVTDTGSGVREVIVNFVTGSAEQNVPAEVTCDDDKRQACSWQAEIPAVLGGYTVKAKAVDAEGNSAWTTAIDVTVVNAGGAVAQVTDTVARAPAAVGKAVNGLLTGLLNVLN